MTEQMTTKDGIGVHRDFLYMGIGWELMDLRQDIEFADKFMSEPYPADEIIERLAALQNAVALYADAQAGPGWDIVKPIEGMQGNDQF